MVAEAELKEVKAAIQALPPKAGAWVAIRATMRLLPVLAGVRSRIKTEAQQNRCIFSCFLACQGAHAVLYAETADAYDEATIAILHFGVSKTAAAANARDDSHLYVLASAAADAFLAATDATANGAHRANEALQFALAVRFASHVFPDANPVSQAVRHDLQLAKDNDALPLNTPLWFNGEMPPILAQQWQKLKDLALGRDPNFQYWVDWYEARLRGDPLDWEAVKDQILLPKEILEQEPAEINKHLASLAANVPPPTPSVSMGNGVHIASETTGELKLGFKDYAQVLADVIQKAQGEFSMALLGPWGTGKTTLVKGNANGKDGLEEQLKPHGYDIVWFSAWKYRRVPEAWIFLYETFAEKMLDGVGFKPRLARILRTQVARYGEGGFVLGLSLLLLPFIFFPFLQAFLSAGLILAAIKIASLWYNGSWAIRKISANYASIARHGEKLGLQATIGEDLKALLCGWIPAPQQGSSRKYWAVPFGLFLLWLWVACNAYSDPVALIGWIGPILWTVGCGYAFYLLHLAPPEEKTKRLLLVVDDLDRCAPEEAVEILENITLLLQGDKAVADRVQVLALADETVLKAAIAKKFACLIERGKDGDETYREHMEKLFLAFLRLPPVSPGDNWELAQHFMNEANNRPTSAVVTPANEPAPAPGASGAAPDLPEPVASIPQQPPAIVPQNPSRPTLKTIPTNDVFTSFEKDTLCALVQAASRKAETENKPISARRIRLFLFQYQLARGLLGKAALSDEDARALASALAGSDFGESGEGRDIKEEIRRVIGMVSF